MLQKARTPLAWRNVTENKLRLMASIAGTAFAVVLMFMETGFKRALLGSQVAVLEHLDCELVIVSPSRAILAVPEAFPMLRLAQAQSLPEVASANPFYIEGELSRWRSTVDGVPRRIRALAYRIDDDVLKIPEVSAQLDKLRKPNTALGDWRSKARFYGPFQPATSSELSNQQIEIVGTFGLGADFQNNGNLVMSEQTFLSLFPYRAGTSEGTISVDVGLVKLKPGSDPKQAQAKLEEMFPDDVVVRTKEEFITMERDFWRNVTPVGTIFNIGVIMGFIVGVTICYQVLFSDISDRLAEFATLRAMGYSSRDLIRVVMEEAVILALLGYGIGIFVSWFLYWSVGQLTGLPLAMNWFDSLFLLGLTLLMCMVSGGISIRKLFTADPAELFK